MFPYFSHFPDDFPRIKSRMRSVGQDMSLSASHPGTEDREPRHPQEIKKWICKSLAGYGKITRNPGQATEASTPHPGSRLQVLHCPCSLPHWGAQCCDWLSQPGAVAEESFRQWKANGAALPSSVRVFTGTLETSTKRLPERSLLLQHELWVLRCFPPWCDGPGSPCTDAGGLWGGGQPRLYNKA